MLAHALEHAGSRRTTAWHARSGSPPPAGTPSSGIVLRYSSHGRAALAAALDDGLMPDEVRHILAGRRVIDAFPVLRGESPATYAAPAVSEMFVAYLAWMFGPGIWWCGSCVNLNGSSVQALQMAS